MSSFSIKDHPPVERTKLRVVDNGEVLTLDFDGAFTKHQGTLWWGCAVAHRAMQVAAIAMSEETLWERGNLYVVSAHPGPGVLDTLDYITECRSKDMLKVIENPECVGMCNREMKFEWWVSNGEKTAHVVLKEDFVSADFWAVVDRLIAGPSEEDERKFEVFKVVLSAKIWTAPLEESFDVYIEDPVAVGEIPGSKIAAINEAKAAAA